MNIEARQVREKKKTFDGEPGRFTKIRQGWGKTEGRINSVQ